MFGGCNHFATYSGVGEIARYFIFLIVSIIISFIIFSLQFFHEREYWEIEVVFQTNFFLEISNKFSDIISEYIEFE